MTTSDTFSIERLDEEEREKNARGYFISEREERKAKEETFNLRSRTHCTTGFTEGMRDEMREWKKDEHFPPGRRRHNSWWERSGRAAVWGNRWVAGMTSWGMVRANPLKADWTSRKDDDFALGFLNRINESESMSQLPISTKLCETCTTLPRPLKLSTSLSKLSTSSKTCKLCGFLYQHFKGSGTPNGTEVEAIRDVLERRENFDDQAIVTSRPGSGLEVVRFELFHEWLRACDDATHPCSSKSYPLPTMVIDLGGHENRDPIRLYRSYEGEAERYVILSHRWSDLGNFCTYRCNVEARYQKMSMDSLPKKFRDAIIVTRRLGIRFLWIDSICIIQRHDGCRECGGSSDWDIERDKMEDYFGSAYLTIAATSVSHGQDNEGFLERQPYAHWVKDQNATCLHSNSVAIDDFQRDVNDANLNKRGWVLQERALSHRTIHFTLTQAYWECGHGIRCETLTAMQNQTAQFLSDSEFPRSILGHFEGNKIRLLEWLFKKYSESDLTRPTDRSVAISGLVKRLAGTFETQCRYGIFKKYQHRCLLWRRSGDKLKRILYPSNRKVPSWSWMAYEGRIAYMEIEFEKVEWNIAVHGPFEALETDAHALNAHARMLQLEDIDEERGKFECDEERRRVTGRGRLIFDEDDTTDITDIRTLRYIVMGKQMLGNDDEREHYVLLIKPSKTGCREDYERVGVGVLLRRDLSFESQPVQVRII